MLCKKQVKSRNPRLVGGGLKVWKFKDEKRSFESVTDITVYKASSTAQSEREENKVSAIPIRWAVFGHLKFEI